MSSRPLLTGLAAVVLTAGITGVLVLAEQEPPRDTLVAPRLEPREIGVVVGNTAGRAGLIDEVSETGVGWIRLALYWHTIERIPGQYEWWIASDIEQALEAGLEVYLSVYGTPGWATDGPITGPPEDLRDWTRFLTAAVERFPDVAVWGIWNEPNEPSFWTGTDQEYLDLVLASAPIIHRAGKQISAPEAAGVRGVRDYVDQLLRIAGDDIDIISIHHYGPAREADRLIQSLPGTQPIWLTEAAHGPDQTEEQQANQLRNLLARQARSDRWAVTMPYHWYTDRQFPIRNTEAEEVLRAAIRGSSTPTIE